MGSRSLSQREEGSQLSAGAFGLRAGHPGDAAGLLLRAAAAARVAARSAARQPQGLQEAEGRVPAPGVENDPGRRGGGGEGGGGEGGRGRGRGGNETKCMGVAQNSRARVTQVLVFGSIYQGAI